MQLLREDGALASRLPGEKEMSDKPKMLPREWREECRAGITKAHCAVNTELRLLLDHADAADDEIARLRGQVVAMWKVLEFYAGVNVFASQATHDKGNRARAILASLREDAGSAEARVVAAAVEWARFDRLADEETRNLRKAVERVRALRE